MTNIDDTEKKTDGKGKETREFNLNEVMVEQVELLNEESKKAETSAQEKVAIALAINNLSRSLMGY